MSTITLRGVLCVTLTFAAAALVSACAAKSSGRAVSVDDSSAAHKDTLIVEEQMETLSTKNPARDLPHLTALTKALPPPTSQKIVRADGTVVEKVLTYPGVPMIGEVEPKGPPFQMRLVMESGSGEKDAKGGKSGKGAQGLRSRVYYLGDDPAVAARLRKLAGVE